MFDIILLDCRSRLDRNGSQCAASDVKESDKFAENSSIIFNVLAEKIYLCVPDRQKEGSFLELPGI